jgi:NAD-dependent deacetylase
MAPATTLDEAAALLRQARALVVLTGAGISAESGIPTFRDAQTGLWSHHDPLQLATPEGFAEDPELVWGWYEWRRQQVQAAQPNPGHRALAVLQDWVAGPQARPGGRRFTLITQNVDDLHERAGSRGVLHLHGSLMTPRCSACATPHPCPPATAPTPDPEPEPGREPGTQEGPRLAPPACAACGGRVRPGVVWFDEALPPAVWAAAEAAAGAADLVLVVGTSGLVLPAAHLPATAARHGAAVVVVNPDAHAAATVGGLALAGRAGDILPALARRAMLPGRWPARP